MNTSIREWWGTISECLDVIAFSIAVKLNDLVAETFTLKSKESYHFSSAFSDYFGKNDFKGVVYMPMGIGRDYLPGRALMNVCFFPDSFPDGIYRWIAPNRVQIVETDMKGNGGIVIGRSTRLENSGPESYFVF